MLEALVRHRLAIGVLLAAAAAGTAIGAALALTRSRTPAVAPPLRARVTWAAGERRAPDFRLRDQTGRVASLAAERGHAVLLTFLDSHCRQECPVEGHLLAVTQRALGAAGNSKLVVISVDPWADTSRSARAFAVRSHWNNWRWFFGSQAQLRPVWKRYGVGVLKTPRDIAHTAVVYAIDPRGFERALYLVPFSPRDVALEVRSLRT